MQRVNYDKVREEVTAAWRTAKNEDNDPVTAGQIRAAAISGDFAAFLLEELDRENGDLVLPVQIAAAIASNQINNLAIGAKRLGGQEAYDTVCKAFLFSVAKYLDGMRALDQGASEAFGVAEGMRVNIEREEVPN